MRTRLTDVTIPIVVAIMAASCSGRQTDSTDPSVLGAMVTGRWAHAGIGPVYRESMTLTQTGTHVSGTGTYAIEAGRSGPTTIVGDWSNGRLALTITRDSGEREVFAGTLASPTHLMGKLEASGVELDFDYVKQ
jgi:hypothetical protein